MRGIRWTFGWVLVGLFTVVVGCGTGEENVGDDSDASVAAPTVTSEDAESTAAPATESTAEPTTTEPPPPDYEAIYRELHEEAIAFIMDPLEQPSDALNCDRNTGCIVVINQALDGQFWQGIGPDNLIISEVKVLEEVTPDLIHLKVQAEAEKNVALVGPGGEVIESFGIPTGASDRVKLIRNGDEWILSSAMDGRSWDRQTYEPQDSFNLLDPLDEPLTPTGEEGVTADGVTWRTSGSEDGFCIEAEKLPLGKMVRCLSRPEYNDTNTTINFTMNFEHVGSDEQNLGIWFGLKVDEGVIGFEDGGEQVVEMFPVETSEIYNREGVNLTVGVVITDKRPLTLWATGPEGETDVVELDWPQPRDQ